MSDQGQLGRQPARQTEDEMRGVLSAQRSRSKYFLQGHEGVCLSLNVRDSFDLPNTLEELAFRTKPAFLKVREGGLCDRRHDFKVMARPTNDSLDFLEPWSGFQFRQHSNELLLDLRETFLVAPFATPFSGDRVELHSRRYTRHLHLSLLAHPVFQLKVLLLLRWFPHKKPGP